MALCMYIQSILILYSFKRYNIPHETIGNNHSNKVQAPNMWLMVVISLFHGSFG